MALISFDNVDEHASSTLWSPTRYEHAEVNIRSTVGRVVLVNQLLYISSESFLCNIAQRHEFVPPMHNKWIR